MENSYEISYEEYLLWLENEAAYSKGENLPECTSFGYDHIKLFPYKNNIPTVKVMLKNGGQVVDSFDDEKSVIVIPTEQVNNNGKD